MTFVRLLQLYRYVKLYSNIIKQKIWRNRKMETEKGDEVGMTNIYGAGLERCVAYGNRQ